MKKTSILLVMLTSLLFAACSKENNGTGTEDKYANSPRSAVPDALAPATWFYGSFSPLSHYDNAGHELGSDWEAARSYEVTKDGFAEFGQYLGTRTGSCATEIYSRLKGTIKFEGNKFTFYPVEGNFKTIRRGCSSNNGTTERVASGTDLAPQVYLWKTEVSSGNTFLYVYDVNDTNMESLIFGYDVVK